MRKGEKIRVKRGMHAGKTGEILSPGVASVPFGGDGESDWVRFDSGESDWVPTEFLEINISVRDPDADLTSPLQSQVGGDHSAEGPTQSRYRWSWNGVTFDFYRLCDILGIRHHAQAHALKKLIRAGRSVKSLEQDLDETIDAILRWKEMIREDRQSADPEETK